MLTMYSGSEFQVEEAASKGLKSVTLQHLLTELITVKVHKFYPWNALLFHHYTHTKYTCCWFLTSIPNENYLCKILKDNSR